MQYGILYRDAEDERSVHQMTARGGTRIIHRSRRREQEGMTSVRGEVDHPHSLFGDSLCGGGKPCKSTSNKSSREKLVERRHINTAIDDDNLMEPTLTHSRAASRANNPGEENLVEPPFPLTGDDIVPPHSQPSAAPTSLSPSPPPVSTITTDTAERTSAPSRLSSSAPSISTVTTDTAVRTSSPSSESVSLDQLTNRGNDEDETTPSNDDPSFLYILRRHERNPSNDPFDDDDFV